jgi:hypothetical protein
MDCVRASRCGETVGGLNQRLKYRGLTYIGGSGTTQLKSDVDVDVDDFDYYSGNDRDFVVM